MYLQPDINKLSPNNVIFIFQPKKSRRKKNSNEKVQNSRLCPLPIRVEAPTTGPVMSGVGEIADKAHTRRTIEVRKKRKGIFVYVSIAISIAVSVYL